MIGESSQRIVEQWPGRGTGDVYSRTEDGRVWHTTYSSETLTGQEIGYQRGGRMHPAQAMSNVAAIRSVPLEPTMNRKARRAAASLRRRRLER